MKRFLLTLMTASPLAVTTRSSSPHFRQCLDYIPAASLRGALAAKYAARSSTADKMFTDLFGCNGIRCSDGLPATTRIAELNLITCSAQPGAEPWGHVQADVALYAVAKLLNLPCPPPPVECPICGAPVTTLPHSLIDPNGKRCFWAAQYHHRRRWTKNKGIADSPPSTFAALPEGIEFTASVSCSEELETAAGEFLAGVQELAIGSDRSLGFGKVRLLAVAPDDEQIPIDVRQRAYRRRLENSLGRLPQGLILIPVTLATETLVLDSWLRPSSAVAFADLASILPDRPSWTAAIRCIASFTKLTPWRGYNAHPAVQLPRAPEKVLLRGSCFVFANLAADGSIVPLGDDWQLDDLYRFATRREEIPLGELPHLGLGRVQLFSQEMQAAQPVTSNAQQPVSPVVSPGEAS